MKIPPSILIVEDHDFQRRILARMLAAIGAKQVLEAANGRVALAQLDAGHAPGLVICDLDMPEMDGMAFIRHLGKRLPDVPVIIASALDPALLGSVAKMADAYGVRLLGVLEKPVTRIHLAQLIAAGDDSRHRRAVPPAPTFTLAEIEAGIRNHEFVPFFQPKLDMRSGAVVGAEALARWRHPTQGIVSPYGFILTLEQADRIDALTFLMLEQAAHATRRLRAAGLDVTVSVNLSTTSLSDVMLADRVTEIVTGCGVEPKHMVLEITETAAMTALAPALENLTRLRMKGFGLSIDDYGTGFASLAQLARVPFTELKIDQGFVTGCSEHPNAHVIVEASLALAHGLKLKTVAEGIETQADWNALRALGCDLAQGYFIGRPMDEAAFLEFCRGRQEGVEACPTT
ncbi:MAG: EAL domain-containing response regulator [Rhodocyclaceae bacterium]|jgi:EAL domain-containing protein (putative c-di-GMP-specific phosphodiesterase class I)/ActR/RegA family two-component response regulator|nr:EAL domain-containing response regulator [Rhodocyclaceae bacterium]